MPSVSVAEFLANNGVPKAMLRENVLQLNKINEDGINIFMINNFEYLWMIKGRFVLCNIFKIDGIDNVKVLLSSLQGALRNNIKRRRLYCTLRTFMEGDVHVKPQTLETIFIDRERFNYQIIIALNDHSLVKYFSELTDDFHEIMNRFKSTVIGLDLFELECTSKTLRYIFHRYYDIIQSQITQDDTSLNQYIKSVSRGEGVEENSMKILDTSLRVSEMLRTLIKFIMLCHNSGSFDKFRQNVLNMVVYRGIPMNTHKRKNTCVHKRPKSKHRKLTWRDKRPPRIKTDLPVSMPKIVNKRRREKLKVDNEW